MNAHKQKVSEEYRAAVIQDVFGCGCDELIQKLSNLPPHYKVAIAALVNATAAKVLQFPPIQL